MKKTSLKPSRKDRTSRSRTLLLSRKAKVRKIRKIRKGTALKGPKKQSGRLLRSRLRRKGLKPRRKRRLHRLAAVTVPAPVPAPVQAPVLPTTPPENEQVVVPLPANPVVASDTPQPDAYQQGYNEAYDVGFDAGFAKGFEDGHKLEFK